MNKTPHQHHYPPKTVIPFILIFLLGVFLVVLFHPRIWFDPLSGYVTRKLEQHLNAEFLISSVDGNFNRAIQADSLQILNKAQTFTFRADNVSVSYRNIFILAMTRTIDTLKIVNPVFIAGPDSFLQTDKQQSGTFLERIHDLPGLKIKTIQIRGGMISNARGTGETENVRNISGILSVSTRGLKTILDVNSLSFDFPEEELSVDSLNGVVSATEGLIKIHALSAFVNNMHIDLSGKFQPIKSYPFKGEILVQKIRPANWIPKWEAYPDDVLDILLDFSGNRDHLRGNFSVQGVLGNEILRQCEGTVRVYPDNFQVNHLLFNNPSLDALIRNFRYEKGHLTVDGHVNQVVFPEKISFLTGMGISGDFAASGHFPDSLSIHYLFTGNYRDELTVDRIEGGVIYLNQDLVFSDTTFVNIPGAGLELSGRIDSMAALDIRFEIQADGFQHRRNHTEFFTVNDARIQGRLKGRLSNPDLSAIYLINDADYNQYHLSRARGAASVEQIRIHPSGNLFVDFNELHIPPYSFKSGGSFLEFKNDTVLISSLNLSTENNQMELVGKFTLDSLLLIQEFAASLKGNNLYLQSPFQVDLRNRQVSVSPVNMQFNEGVFLGEGTWDKTNQFLVNIKGSSLNLSQLLSLSPEDIPMDGDVDFTLQMAGNRHDPTLAFQGRIKNFIYDEYAFEDVSAKFTYHDSVLILEKAGLIQNRRDYLNLFGRFPLEVTLDKGFAFHLPSNKPFALTTEVNQLSIGVLSSLHTRIQELQGVVDGIITAEGFYHDPAMNVNLTIQDFKLNQFTFNRILSQLKYENKKIAIQNFNLKNESGDYKISGFYPVDLRIQPVSDRVQARDSMFIRIEGTDGELSYLTAMIRAVEGAKGSFMTRLELSGSPKKPSMDGYLSLEKSTVTLKNVLNPARNVEGTFTVKDNSIDVNLKANMEKQDTRLFNLTRDTSKKQNVSLTGDIDIQNIFNPDLDLHLKGNKIYIRTLNDRIDLIGDGDITLKGQDTLRAVGIYATREGVLNFNFKRPVQNQPPRNQKRVFEYILDIPIDGNVFLRNELIDAELEGDVVLEKRAEERQILAGNLTVLSGKFYYYSAIFDIESGEITFDPYANNITLNFRAVTPVMDGSNQIIATLTGDIDKPVIELTDEKNMFTSQAEIIQLLTTGTVSNGQLVTGAAQSYLATIFEKELERTASEWGGFERVDLKSQGSLFENPNLDSLSILLERRIGKDLYLSYEQALSNENANRSIELEYRLNRNFSIIGEADDESVSFSYRIRFQY